MSTTVKSRIPSYRLHKPTGQAVVTLDGRDFYLGRWNTKQSHSEYNRLVGEWVANDHRLPGSLGTELMITELAVRYWRFAEKYYVKHGRQTATCQGIRVALRILRESYGRTAAANFGPLALKALQQKMIGLQQSRRYVNDNIDRIRRLFKWAVSEQLVPPAVHQALQTVPGLRKGRTQARETQPVLPVDDKIVEATLPHLPSVVADMALLQRLTGSRPIEICLLRPCDVDDSAEVWTYVPESHKTEHYGRERIISIGPKGQDILRPYLLRDKSAYCFVPAESECIRSVLRRENRQTPLTPSQAKRSGRPNRRRSSGQRYTTNSYRRAIARACDLAFPPAAGLSSDQLRSWSKSHRWSPNRLRHTAATEIRRRFGLEAAQVTLGHASADVSQIYAERDLAKAAAVMREVG